MSLNSSVFVNSLNFMKPPYSPEQISSTFTVPQTTLGNLSTGGDYASRNSALIANIKAQAGFNGTNPITPTSNSFLNNMSNVTNAISDISNAVASNSDIQQSASEKGILNAVNIGSKIAPMFGPAGKAIGMGLQIAGLGYNIANQLFAPTTEKFYKDNETIKNVGSDYMGAVGDVDKAVNDSGKRFGLLSSRDYHKANQRIYEARQLQSTMERISDQKREIMDRKGAMADVIANKHYNKLSGGYSVFTQANKKGGVIKNEIDKIKEVRKILNDPFKRFFLTLPINLKSEDLGFDMEEYWKEIGMPENFYTAFKKGFFKKEGNDYLPIKNPDFETNILSFNPEDGSIENKKESFKKDKNGYSYFYSSEKSEGELDFLQSGGKIKDDYEKFFETLPSYLQTEEDFNMKLYWENNGKPKDFEQAVDKDLFVLKDGIYHAYSVVYDKDKDEYTFLKSKKHPTVNKEIDWYLSDDAKDFRDKYYLDKTGKTYKYRRRENVDSFKNGGSFNLIPEGALHARKHNIETEGITHKGIPVITEENGQVKQHAEIEVNEIILHLELTKELESLFKQYKEEQDSNKKTDIAIKAGKLLSDEILNNTEDKTGLIKETHEV